VRVKNILYGSQAYLRDIEIGDVVTGLNGVDLSEFHQGREINAQLVEHIISEQSRPLILNFNGIEPHAADSMPAAAAVRSAPAPATAHCVKQCGFSGAFDVVAAHEKTCDAATNFLCDKRCGFTGAYTTVADHEKTCQFITGVTSPPAPPAESTTISAVIAAPGVFDANDDADIRAFKELIVQVNECSHAASRVQPCSITCTATQHVGSLDSR
jgi:hypothetical protein